MKFPTLFAIIFSGTWALVGVIFLIIGIAMLKGKKKKVAKCTSITSGKVVDIVKRETHDRDGQFGTSWYPVFEYNIGELKFIKESSYGSSPPKYAIGQSVEIHYNPENHNEYYVEGDTVSKTLSIVFTIVGVVAIIIAVVAAILILRFVPQFTLTHIL